jgi:hypothetical protein
MRSAKPFLSPRGGITMRSGVISMSSNRICVSGMPRRPIAGSRLPITRPFVSSRIAMNPPMP